MRRLLLPLAALLVLLVSWELGVRLGEVPPFLVPAPSRVLEAAWEARAQLGLGFLATGRAALLGWLASALVGVSAAVLLASWRPLEEAIFPFTVLLQTVPLVAVAPLLVNWFGFGELPVIVSAFLVSLFPVIANTLGGLRSVDPALRDLFRLYGASRWARLTKLELLAALPSVLTGLRISGGLAVIGAIVGEFFASFAGDESPLGLIVTQGVRQSRTDLVFAAVALGSLLGLLFLGGVELLSRGLLRRWHPSEQETAG